jgi:hypothetical protein
MHDWEWSDDYAYLVVDGKQFGSGLADGYRAAHFDVEVDDICWSTEKQTRRAQQQYDRWWRRIVNELTDPEELDAVEIRKMYFAKFTGGYRVGIKALAKDRKLLDLEEGVRAWVRNVRKVDGDRRYEVELRDPLNLAEPARVEIVVTKENLISVAEFEYVDYLYED